MKSGRASIQDLFDERRNSSTSGPVLRKFGNLLLGWDLASEEKPKKAFRKSTKMGRYKVWLDLLVV